MGKIINLIAGCSQGYDVYGVGGFVRDLLLKRVPKDIDIAVNKDAEKFSAEVAKSLKAKLVVLDEAGKIYRIALKNGFAVSNIDISLFDGKTIEEDLGGRDFTVNAAAF